MAAYIVTRHLGAIDWARSRNLAAQHLEHLDVGRIRKGDVVIGTLPVSLAAEVCSRGGRYLHLVLDVPVEDRGRELTANEMRKFGADIQEYRVERIGDDA